MSEYDETAEPGEPIAEPEADAAPVAETELVPSLGASSEVDQNPVKITPMQSRMIPNPARNRATK